MVFYRHIFVRLRLIIDNFYRFLKFLLSPHYNTVHYDNELKAVAALRYIRLKVADDAFIA